MSTTKTKTEVITLNPIKMSTFTVHIEGTSDLILCKKARSFELPEIFKQSHPKGTKVAKGTVITIIFRYVGKDDV